MQLKIAILAGAACLSVPFLAQAAPTPVPAPEAASPAFDKADAVKAVADLASALEVVTSSPARNFRLYPKKGTVSVEADADLVVLNDDLSIDKVFAMGRLMVDHAARANRH